VLDWVWVRDCRIRGVCGGSEGSAGGGVGVGVGAWGERESAGTILGVEWERKARMACIAVAAVVVVAAGEERNASMNENEHASG
jgi:hypothetical protein